MSIHYFSSWAGKVVTLELEVAGREREVVRL
jgi:hypothetical protein